MRPAYTFFLPGFTAVIGGLVLIAAGVDDHSRQSSGARSNKMAAQHVLSKSS